MGQGMIKSFFGGFHYANGKLKYHGGMVWVLNRAYCWKRYNWHWRGGDFGTKPNALQRCLAYLDFRRT